MYFCTFIICRSVAKSFDNVYYFILSYDLLINQILSHLILFFVCYYHACIKFIFFYANYLLKDGKTDRLRIMRKYASIIAISLY